ncbi:MAG: lysylphosphatidylglycerol synthase transmembrane domain-containing protein [Geminicoccaceae bacterium]
MALNSPLTRWMVPIIGAVLAIAILFWLYRGLDFDRFVAELASADARWLFLLGGTILAEQLLRGWKWRQILYDLKPIPTWRLFGAILAGYGVAILIPFGISPFVRSWLIARLESLRFASVLVTAAIERFVDGIVFAMIAGVVALSGQVPGIEGDLRLGLAVAGVLSLGFFSALLWLVFKGRVPLARGDARISRAIDWFALKAGARFADLRVAIADGIVWPRERVRQIGVVAASCAMKAVAATHFLWAGLAVDVTLGVFDYLFLLVFAGFALVLARFISVPGGFVIGSGFALHALGVPAEQALAMIMFNHILSILLMVGIGLMVLWRSGIEIRSMPPVGSEANDVV